jgi:signal transduction histidine kinase
MENLIQDLLDFAQIKAGKFRMNLTYFDLKNTIKEVLEILQQKADAKSISLEYNFENLAIDRVYHDE